LSVTTKVVITRKRSFQSELSQLCTNSSLSWVSHVWPVCEIECVDEVVCFKVCEGVTPDFRRS